MLGAGISWFKIYIQVQNKRDGVASITENHNLYIPERERFRNKKPWMLKFAWSKKIKATTQESTMSHKSCYICI